MNNMALMKRFVIFLLLCCCSTLFAQTDIFVSAARSDDSGGGTSWETAKKTVGAALAIAGNSANIHVMVGVYEEATELVIPSGVTIIGGYADGSTGMDVSQQHSPGSNSSWGDLAQCTILSGHYNHRVATVNTGGSIVACVLRNGRTADNGGGVYINGGTVSHCVVTNCVAVNSNDLLEAKGGGVYMQSGSLLNSVVCYNRAENGYGVAGLHGDAMNNTITQNYPISCGTVTDVDHNEYATVIIGQQCWMRENLRTTHFADGTPITLGTTTSTTTAMYYNPATVGSETHVLGLIYNLRAARHGSHDIFTDDNPSGLQGICPDGWHLPSNAEFEQLSDYLQHDVFGICGGNPANVAKALAVDSLWLESVVSCAVGNTLSDNNSTLFSAAPAGYYDGSTQAMYRQCRLWTTSRADNINSHCVYRGLSYNAATLEYGYLTTEYGCSVRCVKD